MSETSPLALTLDDAGVQLGVSARTVRRIMDSGELSFIKVRGALRIPFESLQQYVADHAQRMSQCPTAPTIPQTGRSVTPIRAAKELENLLAQRITKKPARLRRKRNSKPIGKSVGESGLATPMMN